MSLIVVRSFESLIEAYMLKSKLIHEGIACYLFDENIVAIDPFMSYVVGGIKLKVNEDQYHEAIGCINNYYNSPVLAEDDSIIVCPACQSDQLYVGFKSFKNVGGVFSAILTFLTITYPIYYDEVYRCKSCQLEFKSENLLEYDILMKDTV